jgi:hypothetical protein
VKLIAECMMTLHGASGPSSRLYLLGDLPRQFSIKKNGQKSI